MNNVYIRNIVRFKWKVIMSTFAILLFVSVYENVQAEGDSENKKISGDYIAEEIGEGFWITYEDNTYDEYPQGGYCHDTGTGGNYVPRFNMLYLRNEKIDNIPVITGNDKLSALWWDGEVDVYVYPIGEVEYAFSLSAEELGDSYADIFGDGYGTISLNEYHQEYQIGAHYEGEEGTKYYIVTYIDDNPALDYKLVSETVNNIEYTGLQRDDKVTMGIPCGTRLVQFNCEQDYTCFHIDVNADPWYYVVNMSPTPSGVALLDFSGIPDGKYIMVLDGDGSYVATILELDQSNE